MKDTNIEQTSSQLNKLVVEYEKTLHELETIRVINEKLKNSYSYRLGNALIKSKGSFSAFIKLPSKILNIKSEIKLQDEKINSSISATMTHNIDIPLVNFCKLGINPIRLDKNVLWYEFTLDTPKTFSVLHRLFTESIDDIKNHEQAVMRVEIYDIKNNNITSKKHDLFHSKAVGYYRYVDSRKPYSEFNVSKDVQKIRLGFHAWKNRGDIYIDSHVALFDENGWNDENPASTPSSIRVINNETAKKYNQIKVACILDELTYECLQHEVNTIKLSPNSWKREISNSKPDFLLVESCWRGNDNSWGTLTKGSGGGKKLSELLKYCNESNIPTVFWNKEDPVHYEKFSAIAAMFQHVFTSDVNMVKKYKDDHGIDVGVLAFAAQPKLHNPGIAMGMGRKNKAVFAGSYYVEKEDRCNDFNKIMDIISEAGLDIDIYDRCLNLDDPRFKYPERYKDKIIGNLKPNELSIVNSGYKFQINMNSVQDSSSMFARRVFESLASGTPVIGNYSRGSQELFGDMVIDATTQENALDMISLLNSKPELYEEISKRGVREVMRHHTYRHRVKSICDRIGLNIAIEDKKLTMVISAKQKSDVDNAISAFNKQTLKSKHLLIILDEFPGYVDLLSAKIKGVDFTMRFSDSFYEDKSDFIGSNFFVEVKNIMTISETFLEDYYYSNLWA